MKIDRFVKVVLVLIAVLLAVNCVKDLNHSSESGSGKNIALSNTSEGSSSPSMFGSPVEAAAPPSFFQVGKVYRTEPPMLADVKVLKIDNSGWIYVEVQVQHIRPYRQWVNTNQLVCVIEQ